MSSALNEEILVIFIFRLSFDLCRMVVTSVWDKENPQVRELAVYEPAKPIEETARELQVEPGEIIKLASNENPLGPSPNAVTAMRAALGSAQLYPDGAGIYLRDAISA